MNTPPAFHVMAKPAGPLCNLDCTYCFYLSKEQLYPETRRFRMSEATLERYVEQYMQQEVPVIDFAWQGGEPTLMGLDFFRQVVELQEKHRPPGKEVRNMLQTNGTLIDDQWGAFLAEHDFLVGVSVDGPEELHDRYRVDKGQAPTWERVMRGLKTLQQHDVEVNLLCCVHRGNAREAETIYDFFESTGVPYWQFIPIVEHDPSSPESVTPASVRAGEYGTFLTTLFQRWVRRDVGRISIQIVDVALRVFAGLNAGLCIFEETCGTAVALEHNGDVYSCDHFVDPEHLLGNLNETAVAELVGLPQQQAFGEAKKDTLPRQCLECDVRPLCQGGCPKNRFTTTADGEAGLNYLCEGYRTFFRHVAPYLSLMADLYRRGENPALVMEAVRQNPGRFAPADIRRNDPCFCGSRRKFKKCCGRKR